MASSAGLVISAVAPGAPAPSLADTDDARSSAPATGAWSTSVRRWMLLNVAFWTAVALLYTAQWALRGGIREPAALLRLATSQLVTFASCILLAPLIAIAAPRYPFLRGQRRRALAAHAVGLAVFVVVAGAMMGALEWVLPWGWPGSSLASATLSGIYFFVAPDALIYVLVVAVVHAVTYAHESKERAVNEAQLRAQLAEARLNVLSMQLQPHFLFNSLHAISALVREEPKQAERLLARLSELLRHALQSSTKSDTTLDQELAFLHKYLEIQRARFGARLRVTFHVEPNVVATRVPSLLLQPLVENAIRHGVARRPQGGTVEIWARLDGEVVRLAVEDDGVGIPPEAERREGIGLTSTRARLRQLYGQDYQLTLSRRAEGGTVCEIVLPLRGASQTRSSSP
jgi:two-component system LytT family sensor kinase